MSTPQTRREAGSNEITPRACAITGSFTRQGVPVAGFISLMPSRLWVIRDDVAWATLAPVVQLDSMGGFTIEATPTNSDVVPWFYQVDCPAGLFDIYVPWKENGHTLKELISEHRAGSGT
jgi:hypothetical protein